ncbi:GYDIA family GHMP kinase [Williamwhitmania taraxaci]|uniref:Mevalonate kinase n=1 Tax=Williamwhitmania taraxaci TaxID=1640674 RepID=A0A1G6H553_9BACT|nr:GYDIA family GHMP kinase [Williamwhitmania taraxaci]SDB89321.1 Mevalonate kinase [Williamwhitmania taraxaci]
MNFKAHGKLLLSGEYLVLSGAEALAIPLKFGQELSVSEGPINQITWISKSPTGIWFSATFKENSQIIEASSEKSAQFVSGIILAINSLRSNFFQQFIGKTITITADFNMSWGLGSSSSLIGLLAQLAAVDPLTLHRMVSNGSGYDAVAAVSSGAFLYNLRNGVATITPTTLSPVFSHGVYFAYLGKKEDSQAGVSRFLRSEKVWPSGMIDEISTISYSMAHAESIPHLCQLMERHEEIISEVLGIKPLKQLRFNDFEGSVKSLGAWGGDFAMFCSSLPTNQVYSYIAAKGLTPIFRFNDITLGYD